MARARHLKNAPITEALIDLRVSLSPDSIGALEALSNRVRDRFPKRTELRQGQFKFEFGEQPKTEQFVSAALGYICSTADETKKVQFRANGFTFNKLKPYEDWARMRDEARDLWGMYAENLGIEQPIERVALRYINHLDLPLGESLEDYLTGPPSIPEKLPQSVIEYLSRVVINEKSLNAIAIVTQNLQPARPETVETIRLLLDIDVFRQTADMTQRTAWEALEQFHTFKNLIFFESISEKTAEMYE